MQATCILPLCHHHPLLYFIVRGVVNIDDGIRFHFFICKVEFTRRGTPNTKAKLLISSRRAWGFWGELGEEVARVPECINSNCKVKRVKLYKGDIMKPKPHQSPHIAIQEDSERGGVGSHVSTSSTSCIVGCRIKVN